MSDLKMSDVFNLPVSSGIKAATNTSAIGDGRGTFGIINDKGMKHVCHAINSHDKLVSDLAESQAEVERLRDAINELFDDEYKYINDWILCGIATNSKAGTEGRESRMTRYYSFSDKVANAKRLLSKDGE